MRNLATIAFIGAFAFIPLALAETTGETTTDTTDTTDTDTTDTTEDTSDDNCGSCTDPAQAVWITSPADGATVSSPFTVTVDGSYYCYCDTCGCFEMAVEFVTVFANGTAVASGELGSFQIELEPGTYELDVVAEDASYIDTPPITITVDGEVSDSDTGAGADDMAAEEAGCACSTGEGVPAFSGLALLGLLALRRRRG